ncbi:PREDICTED: anosmin-1 [Rhagoletis zephyria]|uniref:anosmin-1 n=1 Tax=Rhagoletis zephyria TaxID=28612 RepID=UPI00081132BC|nr:PREDICTED: anosmin-1 [Rhagoletis zephyria]XP_017480268.1 PREDICTED: anosmin-1 [Rhagoletis zephyria]XP_017480269.1 PREDICTED: anosmin-1 [Rhagoletis zephyria]XP_017480270.1 PREDICTED: anosmin-1 [Rhagoletis zephyria]XP_017480271.1 PREDICTED: anosmin-1 [Rhagoletis zephyria]XP_017480272.1 PREDICTED: anosmin-1 [Rhagoletis zephyria]XP_017480273.1 PREDICTED: anosmin-1 [Rhagoletis zephyria]
MIFPSAQFKLCPSLCVIFFLLQVFQNILHIAGKEYAHASHYNTAVHQHCSTIDVKDKILELQCHAKCAADGVSPVSEDSEACFQQCQSTIYREPRRGTCPNKQIFSMQEISPMQRLSCLGSCMYDADCPVVQKCCDIGCGPACVDAIGVREDVLLPPIPRILRYKLARGNKVELTIESSANSTYYCHVEVRYHFGVSFAPRKLSAWQCQLVEKIAEVSDARSKRIDISFNLKPGHWYQARVAAINAYGFRGYSEPSEEFRLTHHPKPPKSPADLQVVSAVFDGRHYKLKIVWCPSKSNLPIEKYKVIWSLYVRNKDESVITNEAYVKDTHHFDIAELLPDSSYYIQVQSMSINGSRRLKSDKCSILYNTTQPVAPYKSLKCSHQNHEHAQQNSGSYITEINEQNVRSLHEVTMPTMRATSPATLASYEVRYRLNRKFGMIVQITGLLPYKEKVYELCPKESNCEHREYSAIRVRQDSVEFSKLKFNTTYVLKAYRPNTLSAGAATTMNETFLFTTPKCENFKKRFPKMQLKC